MYPEQENVPEKIFGGYLIRRAFELAHLHAEQVASDRPIVARVDRMNFLQPVRIGDKLRFTSRVVYTGETSLCVEIAIMSTTRCSCRRMTPRSPFDWRAIVRGIRWRSNAWSTTPRRVG